MIAEYDILLRLIKERRSVRRFKPTPVEKEKIDLLIEAARWAPSAGDAQPWEFILIYNSDMRESLKTVMTGVMGNMKEGPVLICMCTNKTKKTVWSCLDMGCALENILLTAHSLGLGTCAIGGFEERFIAELLDLPDHIEPCLFITVGYPEKKVPPPSRRTRNELIVKEV